MNQVDRLIFSILIGLIIGMLITIHRDINELSHHWHNPENTMSVTVPEDWVPGEKK